MGVELTLQGKYLGTINQERDTGQAAKGRCPLNHGVFRCSLLQHQGTLPNALPEDEFCEDRGLSGLVRQMQF